MRPELPMLDPLPKGALLALFSVSVAAIGGSFFIATVTPPSPELMRTVAVIGGSFLIAYAIEAVWLVPRVENESDEEHEEWLGFLTGTGIAGLLGVTSALLIAEHRAVGHDNFLDHLGVAWSLVSLLILGGVLVMQPVLADRFGRAGQETAERGGLPGSGD